MKTVTTELTEEEFELVANHRKNKQASKYKSGLQLWSVHRIGNHCFVEEHFIKTVVQHEFAAGMYHYAYVLTNYSNGTLTSDELDADFFTDPQDAEVCANKLNKEAAEDAALFNVGDTIYLIDKTAAGPYYISAPQVKDRKIVKTRIGYEATYKLSNSEVFISEESILANANYLSDYEEATKAVGALNLEHYCSKDAQARRIDSVLQSKDAPCDKTFTTRGRVYDVFHRPLPVPSTAYDWIWVRGNDWGFNSSYNNCCKAIERRHG